MSMNKSRKIAGVIRELMEVSVKAIGAKLPLLFQTLSQLVGACFVFFFLSKCNVQFLKEENSGICQARTW